jgi:hypothetical protein
MPTARGPDPAVEEHFLGALYRGGELLASGKIIEAREHLEKAHQMEPRNEKAQNLLGLTYFKLGLFDLAAQVYEQLVRDNASDPTLRVNLGLVYLKTGDVDRAVHEFESAAELDAGHKKAHNYLGLALAQRGDYERAREHFLLAGSDQMAEKMGRAIENQSSLSVTTRISLSQVPAPEPVEKTASPELSPTPTNGSSSSFHPEPSEADAERTDPAAPQGAPSDLEDLPRPHHDEASAAQAPLQTSWAEHVEERSEVPEFVIEERTSGQPPSELGFNDEDRPLLAMDDAPLVPIVAPLEPMPSELPSDGGEYVSMAEAPTSPVVLTPVPSEGAMWLTEHVAGVPLASEPSPAPPMWESPVWVAPNEASQSGSTWAPTGGSSRWEGEAPENGEALQWPTPTEVREPPQQQWDEPVGEAAEAEDGQVDPAPPLDESHWIMQPVSRTFSSSRLSPLESTPSASWAATPSPLPSTGFVPLSARRLTDLGQGAEWQHQPSTDPFQLGPAGIAVTVSGEMLLRLEGLVAMAGNVSVVPEAKRRRGRPTPEPFGEGPAQLHRARGYGVVYLEAPSGFHSLDLSDQAQAGVDDDGAYLREELVFAFEESVAFENGRLTDELGQWIDLVHLQGPGRVLLRLDGALKAMPVPAGTPMVLPLARLVGWFGRVTPRLAELGGQGAVELTGDGFALLIT